MKASLSGHTLASRARAFGRGAASLVLLSLLCSAPPAEAAPFRWNISPSPETVTVVSTDPPTVLKPASGDVQGVYELDVRDTDTPIIKATRNGYDDMYLRFSLKQEADGPRWEWTSTNASGEYVRTNPNVPDLNKWRRVAVTTDRPDDGPQFWKTLAIEGLTADLGVWQKVDPALNSSPDAQIEYGAETFSAVRAQSFRPGTVVIPNASAPEPIFVTRPWFHTIQIKLGGGIADKTSVALPAFSPRYGPFSYVAFDVAIGLAGLALLGWWFGVKMPARRRLRLEENAQRGLVSRIIEQTSEMKDPADLPPLLGQTLTCNSGASFVVLSLLGRGGMGAVFDAISDSPDRRPDEHWAIKVVFSDVLEDADSRERFRREVAVTSRLSDPNIVKVLDSGLYQSGSKAWPFMVMEKVDGRDLRAYLEDGSIQSVPLVTVLDWILETLHALKTAHAVGVIHRDLKPDNIMITRSGHAKVMDFGIARQVDAKTLTKTGTAMGTPAYMSPEHLNAKDISPAADIYSMGVIMYELLTGQWPYDTGEDGATDGWQLLSKMMTDDPVPIETLRTDLPDGLAEVVMRMLSPSLSTRYASAEAVLDAIYPIYDRLSPNERK